MSIKIGERTLATTRPADLDAALVASTGCSAAEHVAMLGPTCTAYQIARALRPFLSDSDSDGADVGALATSIAEADDSEAIRRATIALLTQAEPQPAAAPTGEAKVSDE